LLSEKAQGQYIENIKSICLENYIQAIEVVKKWKSLSTDEKLRRLLVPLIIYNKLDKFDEPISFVDESVDIGQELDLDNLEYNDQKYHIYDEKGNEIDVSGRHGFVTSSSYIFVREKFESGLKIQEGSVEPIGSEAIFSAGKVSLEELYEEWLPSLNQERMRSTDLLDQILVAYTIKKAQNANEEAIRKLYNLYESSAEGLATNVVKNFSLYRERKDIIQTAKLTLTWLISGYNPKYILEKLLSDENNKIQRKLPRWIKDFYVYYLSEYLPTKIQKNWKESAMADTLMGFVGIHKSRRRAFLALEWLGMFNPYSPINATTLWKNTSQRIKRFNNYCFRPGRTPKGSIIKMGPQYNLTKWLFGAKEKRIYSGMLYRCLADHYSLRERPFQVKDFKDFPSLISKLKNDQDPLSRYIVSKCSLGLQHILRDFNESEPPKTLLKSLKSEFNQLLRTSCLFSEDRFGEIELSQETQALLERKPRGANLIRLNRLLLEAGYPKEIKARSKVREMSVDSSSDDENHDVSLPSEGPSPEENTSNTELKEKIRKILLDVMRPARHAERDVKIFFRYHLDNIPQSQIAKEQRPCLTTRHIKRICQKVKGLAITQIPI
jgi:hypothetical protein